MEHHHWSVVFLSPLPSVSTLPGDRGIQRIPAMVVRLDEWGMVIYSYCHGEKLGNYSEPLFKNLLQ